MSEHVAALQAALNILGAALNALTLDSVTAQAARLAGYALGDWQALNALRAVSLLLGALAVVRSVQARRAGRVGAVVWLAVAGVLLIQGGLTLNTLATIRQASPPLVLPLGLVNVGLVLNFVFLSLLTRRNHAHTDR